MAIGTGEPEQYSYVGPVKLEFNGRIGFSGALINNDKESKSCYLGSIVFDEMDLIVANPPSLQIRQSSIVET